MKRIITAILLAVTVMTRQGSAQEVVIDPSMIASAAANSAEQIDYMIEQIEHLGVLGDKISGIKSYIDDIFPEDGEKITSMLSELGTLEQLASSYTRSITMTKNSLQRIRKLQETKLSDVNSLIEIIKSNKDMTQELFSRAKGILRQGGFTKMEKKSQIEQICSQIDMNTREVEDMILLEERIVSNVQGIDAFMQGVDDFLLTRQEKESTTFTLGGITKLLSTVLMLLGIFCLMWGYRAYILGDSMVYVRIACGILCGVLLLGILSKLFAI